MNKNFHKNSSCDIIRFDSHKDETDTELALYKAIEMGADEINIYGATGSRTDHFIGNLSLLMRGMMQKANVHILDENNDISLLAPGTYTLKKEDVLDRNISLIPYTDKASEITLKGFEYSVRDITLYKYITRGISNKVTDDEAVITFTKGYLYLMITSD